jgi:hypothetical protein
MTFALHLVRVHVSSLARARDRCSTFPQRFTHLGCAVSVGPSHTPVPARSSVSASHSTSRAPFSCLPKASSCRHRCAQPSASTSLLVELPLNRIIFGCGYLTIDHRSYYSAFVPYAFRWTLSVVDCNYCVPVLTISC